MLVVRCPHANYTFRIYLICDRLPAFLLSTTKAELWQTTTLLTGHRVFSIAGSSLLVPGTSPRGITQSIGIGRGHLVPIWKQRSDKPDSGFCSCSRTLAERKHWESEEPEQNTTIETISTRMEGEYLADRSASVYSESSLNVCNTIADDCCSENR
jgi:hypothetical protein